MAIVETITDPSKLYHALQKTNLYKTNFTYEGARALQEYMEQYSEDLGENIEFDPIAWCCEFSEYKSFEDFNDKGAGHDGINNLDDLKDHTTVIELEFGGIIVQDF